MKQKSKAEVNMPKGAKRVTFAPALKMLIALAVLIPAVAAYLSAAWFAMNEDTGSTGASMSTQGVNGALYIAEGTVVPAPDAPEYHNTESITIALEGGLYPISTPDCANWYYVRRDTDAWDALTHQAMHYNRVQSEDWVEGRPGVYEAVSALDETDEMTAFNVASYVLYTDADAALDIYLRGSEDGTVPPIVLTAQGETKQLMDALRIGFVVDADKDGEADAGELKLVYVPVAEDGVGNSFGAAAGTEDEQTVYYYYCIQDAGTGADLAYAPYSFAAEDEIAAYAPGGASLGRVVGEEGTVIYVYIWLEGTDAQAIVGSSDSVGADGDSSISLQIGFTGAN